MATPDVGAIEYELISSINTEYEQLIPISIFPNPFSNQVSINDIEPSTLINVYNVSGTLTVTGTLDMINEAVAEFSAGIYYFTFRSNGEIKIGKAIKI